MELIYILLVILIATRVGAELASRVGQPALVGEILAGICLGLIFKNFSSALPVLGNLHDNEVFTAITDLGIFFLMLLGGLELRPRELAKSSASAVAVAIAGFVLPLALGMGLVWLFVPVSDVRLLQALFIGAALAITAVPVSIRVLMDLGVLKTKLGNLIVSAAVVDDVLSLVLLAILLGALQVGTFPSSMELLILAGKVIAFFGLTILIGLFGMPWLGRLMKAASVDEFELSALLVAGMLYAYLAELLGLHFILGAFMAGLFFQRRTANEQIYNDVREKVSGITSGFLAPIFFASIGLSLDLQAVVAAPVFLVLLLLAAFLGKIAGSGLAAAATGMEARLGLAVGIAMSGRGAVELVLADIAARHGLLSQPTPTPEIVQSLFSAVVIVAIVTTIMTPIALRWALPQQVEKASD